MFNTGGPTEYLLFMSAKGTSVPSCNLGGSAARELAWSASNASRQGIIFVPNGKVEMSMAGSDRYGECKVVFSPGVLN